MDNSNEESEGKEMSELEDEEDAMMRQFDFDEAPLLTPSLEPDVTSTKYEAKILVTYTLPIMATNLFRQVVMSSSVLAVARLGTRELAAANLGLLSANIGGYAVLVGLVSAMDTLANQVDT